jgi:light-regulated signal transduction histidine kinase (bacteriophytochrome)
MASLIDGLLQLSRIGRKEIQHAACDLSRLAREVSRMLHEQDPHRTTTFEIEDGLTAQGDPQLLRIVLDNLLGNAWKFTARTPGAKIEVGSIVREGKRVYFVRDNGVGFDMAYATKLFGAFQRLHHQSEFPGTGIGLATVQRIVGRHRGKIWAEAAPDRGAAFFLSIPPAEPA